MYVFLGTLVNRTLFAWPNIAFYINLPLQSVPSGGHKHVPLVLSHDPPFLPAGNHILAENIDNCFQTINLNVLC